MSILVIIYIIISILITAFPILYGMFIETDTNKASILVLIGFGLFYINIGILNLIAYLILR